MMSSTCARHASPQAGWDLSECAAIAVRCFRLERREEQVPVHGMEQINPSHTHRAYGVPMIGIGQANELLLTALSRRALLMVLEGHLKRYFIGCGTIIGIKYLRQSRRGNCDQFLCQV